MYKKPREKCFTLIEVLVSIVIVAIISMGSYAYYMVSSRSVQDARNRSMATNLMSMSIEEVRKAANSDFDSLGGFSFSSLPPEFSGFARSVTVTSYQGSSECKKVDIAVTWQEHGKTKSFHESMLISRPPEPLPGNIEGTVVNSETSEPVSGVTVTIYYKDKTSLTFTRQTDSNGYYTFTDTKGNYLLKPGVWILSATRSGYYDYPGGSPVEIEVPEQDSVTYDFAMDPLPEDAHIRGRVIDKNSGAPINHQMVDLYKDAHYQQYKWSSSDGSFEFTVHFDDTNPQCFTVTTGYPYGNRWSWNYDYYYPFRYKNYLGDFCDPYGWGKNYNYRGWSSAVIQENGTPLCGNPWFGSEATDRICVNPGDDLNIGVIPLVPLPTATIEGTLYDSEGHPIQGQIYYIWRNTSSGSDFGWSSYIDTDANGHYSVTVPAEQEYFPDNQAYYIRMRARARVKRMRCCDVESDDWSYTRWPYTYVGPIYAGDVVHQDFTIPSLSDQNCGNIKGYIKDFKTGGGIQDVDLRIYWDGWRDNVTDAAGYFEIKCPDDVDSCALTTGWHHFAAVDNRHDINGSEYYILQSYYYGRYYNHSEYWYNRDSIPEMSIVADTTVDYGTIWLYPKGFGKIKGRVVDAGTDTPLQGAEVRLNVYSNVTDPFGGSYDETVYTDSNGEFEFNNVIETWPPPDVVDNSYFAQSAKYHTVTVSAGDQYFSKSIDITNLQAGQLLDMGDIKLGAKGGGA